MNQVINVSKEKGLITSDQSMELLNVALQKGVSPEVLQQLLDMRKQLSSEMAREAFYRDKALLQAAIVPPQKTKVVREKSGKERYRYAPLDPLCRAINEGIHKTGNKFSYAWQPTHSDDNSVTMRCVLTHVQGHSEESSFRNYIDKSSYMSGAQKIATARSFAKRYTLEDVMGITATEDTDDNEFSGHVEDTPTVAVTPMTRNEIETAYKVIQQADDTKAAWDRVKGAMSFPEDDAAYEELKSRTTQLVNDRKALKNAADDKEAKKENIEKLKRAVAPGITRETISLEQQNKICEIMQSMQLQWDVFVKDTAGRFAVDDVGNILAEQYKEVMQYLKRYTPIIDGVTKISMDHAKKIHMKLNESGFSGDEFKKYHGINSTLEIDLADLDNIMDFDKSGFIDWLKAEIDKKIEAKGKK